MPGQAEKHEGDPVKNTVHNQKWSAKVKIGHLQKVKGAERAEKPSLPSIVPKTQTKPPPTNAY